VSSSTASASSSVRAARGLIGPRTPARRRYAGSSRPQS
jgi:hypothetical protein